MPDNTHQSRLDNVGKFEIGEYLKPKFKSKHLSRVLFIQSSHLPRSSEYI